jgi:Asp-tRNA(Asn)/Glu-tRNA(Gln) amidotransferase A subunit family amidase
MARVRSSSSADRGKAFGALEAAAQIASGALSSEELVLACLAQYEACEPDIHAFAHLDRDHILSQARIRDEERRNGMALGPLHGVPVAIKDIIDTKDEPTECGSPALKGRLPWHDAALVTRLKSAGAVLFGKTVTTEFAYYSPGKTRNPHRLDRTPGGSSSGSAAAVAAQVVPLAVGTQTNGSVIRPASFCGVVGFKPTHGLIPRTGVLTLSRNFDQVGVFAANLTDAALLAESLVGYDPGDPDTRPVARPHYVDAIAGDWPLAPRIGFMRGPNWDQAEPDTQAAFAELCAALGDAVTDVEPGADFAKIVPMHRAVMEADMAHNLGDVHERFRDLLSPQLRELIERGRKVAAVDYLRAVSWIWPLNGAMESIFDDVNVIMAAAAPGPAPGPETTGNPVFCSPWTYLGVPAITLPLLQSGDGLPIGVQLVARRGDDAKLLRTARWIMDVVGGNKSRRGKGRPK